MTENPLDEREWALWRSFALMSRQLWNRVEQRLQAEAGISAADFEILHALWTADQHRVRVGALGEMLMWEKSRISHQVSRMERRGLVERVVCEEDLRGTWVGLTSEGSEVLAPALLVFARAVREAYTSRLTPDIAPQFAATMMRVVMATDPTA
ncbi:MarR family transcriptional regulator [Demequina capsici]|uniref:MarR family transcriptional regulator n=1 Tax=Demequina capsici TaxID=3075620 RepID=A0AA96FAN4_9MICO|nr:MULTISPECIES: MarR family transcriptional regulator [unclassified Demequina]WNM25825.1 MarR family transcriptional regulator [Demequina sp. OYTSA14]WNM28720.1 MarR family transcriptional regulator [Demequina sp. PMTSA13]